MSTRRATHSGSWYTSNAAALDLQLSSFLDDVKPTPESKFAPPIKGCKAIIAPHAGYSYSGSTASWAYKCIDVTEIKRVFILGPSHHYYLDGCALSKCQVYETPLGNLPLDLEMVQELRDTGQFQDMRLEADEAEHSIEMHLPFVRKIFQGLDIAIVPILVGAIDHAKEAHFGQLLAPYLAREDTIFVISSDFCHWGKGFSYTWYLPSPTRSERPVHLSRFSPSPDTLQTHPIHASISLLDHDAMSILTLPRTSTSNAHAEFSAYLIDTKNTICGRHPIGVLFGALAVLEAENHNIAVRWVKYAQSSHCLTYKDSSVSYASAYVTL